MRDLIAIMAFAAVATCVALLVREDYNTARGVAAGCGVFGGLLLIRYRHSRLL